MVMVLIVFINSVLRYCFNSGVAESEEILRYLFVWATFLGIAAVYRERGHIAVTMLTDRLSPKIKPLFECAANILALCAFGVLTAGSLMYMEASRTTIGELTGLPFTCIIAATLLCGLACICIVLTEIFRQLRSRFRGDAV